MQRIKGKALISILLRISWSAYIYLVWKEHNCRLNQHTEKTPKQVLEHVKDIIRLRLAGLKEVKHEKVNDLLCRNWRLSYQIFINLFFDVNS